VDIAAAVYGREPADKYFSVVSIKRLLIAGDRNCGVSLGL